MPDIEFVRGEIQRTRLQVLRQRKEIMQLQRAGIPSTVHGGVQSQRNRVHLEPNICRSLTAALPKSRLMMRH